MNLSLSGNRISTVHKNAFNGLKLRKLELQSNPISAIEHQAFVDLANYLEELILSTTALTTQLTSQTLMQILTELPNLKRLSLRFIRSINIDPSRDRQTALILRKLTQLSLQSCGIGQLGVSWTLSCRCFPIWNDWISRRIAWSISIVRSSPRWRSWKCWTWVKTRFDISASILRCRQLPIKLRRIRSSNWICPTTVSHLEKHRLCFAILESLKMRRCVECEWIVLRTSPEEQWEMEEMRFSISNCQSVFQVRRRCEEIRLRTDVDSTVRITMDEHAKESREESLGWWCALEGNGDVLIQIHCS